MDMDTSNSTTMENILFFFKLACLILFIVRLLKISLNLAGLGAIDFMVLIPNLIDVTGKMLINL